MGMGFEVETSILDREDPPFVGALEPDDVDLDPPNWLFYSVLVTSVSLVLALLSWGSALLQDMP